MSIAYTHFTKKDKGNIKTIYMCVCGCSDAIELPTLEREFIDMACT